MTIDDIQEQLDEPKNQLEVAIRCLQQALEAKTKKKVVESLEAAIAAAEDAVDLMRDIDPDGG